MKKQEKINSILKLMVSKGFFKEGDFNYNIYANLMKNETMKTLLILEEDIKNDIFIK